MFELVYDFEHTILLYGDEDFYIGGFKNGQKEGTGLEIISEHEKYFG